MNSLTEDRDDDVRLPSRGAERRTAPRDETHADDEQDREFTLSTGTVLGLFFALALLCAVFFGFGYTMGRKSGQSSAIASAPSAEATSEAAAAKPSASAPAIQAIPGYLSQNEADAANRNTATQTVRSTTVPLTSVIVPTGVAPVPKPVKPPAPPVDPDAAPAVATERKPQETRPAVTVPATVPATAAAGAGSSYVQIAAVSHQEDADVLLSALKRRGYAVFTRPGDTDKLIHVQVGPFASKKDADAMRQRLLGDGYNAIVK